MLEVKRNLYWHQSGIHVHPDGYDKYKSRIWSTLEIAHRKFDIFYHEMDIKGHWHFMWSRKSSGAPEFTPSFCGVRFAQSLVFCVVFCRSLFVVVIFYHCIACPSIYGFWLPLWYLKTCFTLKNASQLTVGREGEHKPDLNTSDRRIHVLTILTLINKWLAHK